MLKYSYYMNLDNLMIEAKRLGREIDAMSNETYKKYKDIKGYTLTYFGAGWDFKPVSNKIYSKFTHFIFIDSLPKLSHYEPGMSGYNKCKDRESFIKTLVNAAREYNLKLISNKDNLLTFENDKIKVEYYISTTVSEALTNPQIRKKMNKSIWLHEEGFNPYNYGLKIGDLPNLVEFRAKLREL